MPVGIGVTGDPPSSLVVLVRTGGNVVVTQQHECRPRRGPRNRRWSRCGLSRASTRSSTIETRSGHGVHSITIAFTKTCFHKIADATLTIGYVRHARCAIQHTRCPSSRAVGCQWRAGALHPGVCRPAHHLTTATTMSASRILALPKRRTPAADADAAHETGTWRPIVLTGRALSWRNASGRPAARWRCRVARDRW